MNLPHDIDQLMWSVAESGNSAAREDFERRFPELRSELAKRNSLLDGLRNARSLHIRPLARPAFRPILSGRATPLLRPKLALALVLVAGIAIASAAYRAIYGEQPVPAGPHSNQPLRTPCNKPTEPKVQYTISHPKVPQEKAPEVTLAPPQTIVVPVDDDQPKCMKPQTLKLKQADLRTAATLIAKNSGLTLEFAPDLSNPKIDIDYHNQGGLDMLKDLGQRYGFSLVEDGVNKYLLIPQKAHSN